MSGNNVTFTWTAPPTGSAPTSYRLVARMFPTGPLVAAIPVSGSTFSVDAPAGTYFVSLIAVNAAGESTESNQVTVTIP